MSDVSNNYDNGIGSAPLVGGVTAQPLPYAYPPPILYLPGSAAAGTGPAKIVPGAYPGRGTTELDPGAAKRPRPGMHTKLNMAMIDPYPTRIENMWFGFITMLRALNYEFDEVFEKKVTLWANDNTDYGLGHIPGAMRAYEIVITIEIEDGKMTSHKYPLCRMEGENLEEIIRRLIIKVSNGELRESINEIEELQTSL